MSIVGGAVSGETLPATDEIHVKSDHNSNNILMEIISGPRIEATILSVVTSPNI